MSEETCVSCPLEIYAIQAKNRELAVDAAEYRLGQHLRDVLGLTHDAIPARGNFTTSSHVVLDVGSNATRSSTIASDPAKQRVV